MDSLTNTVTILNKKTSASLFDENTLQTTEALPTQATSDYPLFVEGKNLEKIPYCASIHAEVVYLPPEVIEEKLKFTYSESIFLSHEVVPDHILKPKRALTESTKEVMARLREPSTAVAIFDTGNPILGMGCKAIRDIAKGECIMVYAGIIENAIVKKTTEIYGVALNDVHNINAAKIGNLSRFINHAPTGEKTVEEVVQKDVSIKAIPLDEKLTMERDELVGDGQYFSYYIDRKYDTEIDYLPHLSFLDKSLKSELVTANCIFKEIILPDGQFVEAIFANETIPTDSMLGIDYGSVYWKHHSIAPIYLKKNGQLVTAPKEAYSPHLESMSTRLKEGKNAYQLGQQAYQKKAYYQAFKHISKAIYIFSDAVVSSKTDIDANRRRVVTCYYSLSLVFHTLKMKDDFFYCCNIACQFAWHHPQKNNLIDPVLKKHHAYLIESMTKADHDSPLFMYLYLIGVDLIKEKHTYLGIKTLELSQEQYHEKTGKKMSRIEAALSDAYKTLKDKKKSLEHIQNAITLNQLFLMTHGYEESINANLLKDIEKLKALETFFAENTQN